MRVKAGGLRGMPRAGLNGWRLRRQSGRNSVLFRRVATPPCAARTVQSAAWHTHPMGKSSQC